MRDGLGRDIRYLRLSVTDKCNCRCTYCMPAGGVPRRTHDDLLSFEELEAVVRAACELGVRKVRLTGGEPLVRRGIVDLVALLAQVPGVDELAMTTNATLLAPVAARLREAGLDRLNVSLDTLDADRYARITRTGSLEDALEGLDAARAAGFTGTKVNCVLMGGVNDDEVAGIAGLARDADLSVRFIELMPMGECAHWPAARFVPADVVLEALPGLVPLGADGVAELYRMPGWRGTVGLIQPVSHRFCSGCDRIRVTADGMLKPCLHSAAEIPLRELSGDALLSAIAEGIAAKPVGHSLGEGGSRASQTPRDMNEIGG